MYSTVTRFISYWKRKKNMFHSFSHLMQADQLKVLCGAHVKITLTNTATTKQTTHHYNSGGGPVVRHVKTQEGQSFIKNTPNTRSAMTPKNNTPKKARAPNPTTVTQTTPIVVGLPGRVARPPRRVISNKESSKCPVCSRIYESKADIAFLEKYP